MEHVTAKSKYVYVRVQWIMCQRRVGKGKLEYNASCDREK